MKECLELSNFLFNISITHNKGLLKPLYLQNLIYNQLIDIMKRIFFTVFCLIFGFSATYAQCIKENGQVINVLGGECVNTIITAVPFLRIAPDARSGAMGDVGIATSADPNAMHFNASKLAFAEKEMGISVTYTPWLRALNLNDIYLAYLSAYRKINEIQTVGIGLRFFSLGDIQFTDEQGTPLTVGRPNEFEIALAYARQLVPDKLSVALTGKFIYSNLAAGQSVGGEDIQIGTAGAADLSLTYKTPINMANGTSDLTLGVALSSLGTKITYTNSINKDYIPANFGIGGAWKMNFDEFNSFTIAADINKLMVPTPCIPGDEGDCFSEGDPNIIDHKEHGVVSSILKSFGDAPGGFSEELSELMYSFGLEYWYDNQFAVRAGYYGEAATKGNRKFFTLGLGIKYNVFGLNFSYLVPVNQQRNPLDNTLRFSLLFDFAAFDAEEG